MSDTELITPEEQVYYSGLFKQPWLSDIVEVFKRKEELFDLLCRLRRNPKYISFSLSSGTRLQFLSVEKKWVDGGLRLLLSDGTVGGYQPLSFPCARVLDEDMGPWSRSASPDADEIMASFLSRYRRREQHPLRLPVEQRVLAANEETRTALKHFGCQGPLAKETVEQLALVNAPIPDENFAIIVRQWQKTGKTSPKEVLLSALEKAVNSALSTKLSGECLWQLLYDDSNPMGMTVKELLSGQDATTAEASEPRFGQPQYHQVIARSIVNFASEFDDLVTTPLWSHPLLDTTLKTAYERGFLEPQRKGDTLAHNVATRLGFRRVPNGWAKADERHELRVTLEGNVYINQTKVCIHPVEDQSLLRGDVAASLLMTLATDLRRRVLSGPDLEAVEALLPLGQSVAALKDLTK